MVTIAGGILLALAILAIGFLMVMLFVSGVLVEIAWELAKWLAKLALSLSVIPIAILTLSSKSNAMALIGMCVIGGILIYLDSLDSA